MNSFAAGRLVGDVGGTHARFRLLSDGPRSGGVTEEDQEGVRAPDTFDCRDFSSLEAVIQAFLDMRSGGRWPACAVLAVAGPVADGRMRFTNQGWSVSETELTSAGRFRTVRLINDFAACALSLPVLGPQDLLDLGPPVAGDTRASLAVLGPGTGFGVAALIREGERTAVLSGEGGHMDFAPVGERQIEILKVLARRFGRVSLERLLSGPGIVEIYEALCALEGRQEPLAGPEAVTAAAASGAPLALESLDIFVSALGAASGDFALAYGARGGVYIAGGVALSLKARLQTPAFRRAFEAKGRFADYVRAVPTRLITHPYPNLLGAAAAFEGP